MERAGTGMRSAPNLLSHALGHQAIVERFGRLPHRNIQPGRPTTAAESFLDRGGFTGADPARQAQSGSGAGL